MPYHYCEEAVVTKNIGEFLQCITLIVVALMSKEIKFIGCYAFQCL